MNDTHYWESVAILTRAMDLARIPKCLNIAHGTFTHEDGTEHDAFLLGSEELGSPICTDILDRAGGHPLVFQALVYRLWREWLWARAQASACEGPEPNW